MCSKRYRNVKHIQPDFEKSWEEEIERLRNDIKRTENKILMTEQYRLAEKGKLSKGQEDTESDSTSNLMNLYTSPKKLERVAPHRIIASTLREEVNLPTRQVDKLKMVEPSETRWVSPSDVTRRRRQTKVIEDPFSKCPDSCFDIDCGSSSVISLDFGLISPNKNWRSPPQRIERAQNKEWSSPHRVIDKPDPETSPGNWVSMKESAYRHPPPTLGTKEVQVQSGFVSSPGRGGRSASQTTYTVSTNRVDVPESSRTAGQATRKTSVLLDYEPERVPTKKRTGSSTESIESGLLPTRDKVRRVVESGGHVIKISLLEDFEAPGFSKIHEKPDKTGEPVDKESAQSDQPDKLTKKTVIQSGKSKTKSLKTITSKLQSPQAQSKKKEAVNDEGGRIGVRTAPVNKATKKPVRKTDKQMEPEDEGEGDDKEKENKEENLNADTHKMIMDLEKILRGSKKDETDGPGKKKTQADKEKCKKLTKSPKGIDERPIETAETKRKRSIDPKVVQDYIKSQKQKRLEQVKTEKKTKVAEREARKKKLEELRIKTLKLAAQSKKKKPASQPTIKLDEPGAEDDVTMSLGLKQTKPKVSYNESLSNLRKKTTQQKPQPTQKETKEDEEDEEGREREENETVQPETETDDVVCPYLTKPDNSITGELKTQNDLNATLMKLAETLHLKIEEKEKQLRSRPIAVKDSLPQVASLESVKSLPENRNRNLITVDVETIHSLKEDIKKISENFKVLHEIIIDKTSDLSPKKPPPTTDTIKESPRKEDVIPTKDVTSKQSSREDQSEIPDWLKTVIPRPHPYNFFTAFRHKMNLDPTPSVTSQESSAYAEALSNKYDSDFEALSIPSNRLRSAKEICRIGSSKSTRTETSEEIYYTMKEDSGSELSSSILDSDKQSLTSADTRKRLTSIKESVPSSILTEITSRSVQLATSKGFETTTTTSRSLISRFSNDRDNLILVTPDIKLISNDLHQEKLNNNINKNTNISYKSMSTSSKNSLEPVIIEELNNSEVKSNREQKTDSTIAEVIENLSETEKPINSLKTTNGKPQNSVQRIEEVRRKSFFQPEVLHLQFQAELTLLETFQQSLSQFLEAERLKTLTEVNKIVHEKAIERVIEKEDQAVQTTFIEGQSDKTDETESESVKTEINVSEEESTKTEKDDSNSAKKEKIDEEATASEMSSSKTIGSLKDLEEKETPPKDLETFDFSNGHSGISFQMLNRMMKDEELRSEHQLALIRLREKTLNEKVKAELTFLEMKKRALKERGSSGGGGGVGGDEEYNVSAIKKKQRGILLKYQSEKEEIERLKKMHKIASEERKIMIKQQKQIEQMQMSTKDMIIKLKKREKSPQKRSPLKPKVLKSSDSQSEIQEDIPVGVSDSIPTESVCSVDDSTRHSSDLDVSSRSNVSEEESEILRRNTKTLESKISNDATKTKKALAEMEKYPRKRHSVEELLSWTKRLEEKENRLKELEKQTMSAADLAKNRLMKSLKNVKISMRDRSTSPFQFPDSIKSVTETSPTINEVIEAKRSTTISEAIVESSSKIEMTDRTESVPEKLQTSVSEDIPEQFTKKTASVSTSRTMEYNSESFESPSSSETPKTKPEMTRSKSVGTEGSNKGIAIKLSLSPRMQSPRRRYSSGSDDSLNLSHTETASEQSDLESRIAALHEQLRTRKLEAERLRREQKKAQRERLKVKEQSLLKQIQAYDAYIQKKKQELEQEYEHSTQTIMKPLIKHPKVAEKSSIKRQEPLLLNEGDKLGFYARITAKTKDKDDSMPSEKATDKESDSEISEQIKDSSESVKEQIKEESESVREEIVTREEEDEETEDEKAKELIDSIPEAVSPTRDISETVKSTTLSESLPEQEVNLYGSQSESEDQSISIKTTLHSPEKPETEKGEMTPTSVAEDLSPSKQTLNEDQFDSYESDFEEKSSTKVSDFRKQMESSDVATEIGSEISEQSIPQSEKEKEEQEEEETKESLATETEDSIPEIHSSSTQSVEVDVDRTPDKANTIADSLLLDLILESVKVFSSKKAKAEKKSEEISLEALSSFLAKEIISEAVDDMVNIYNRKAAAGEEYEEEEEPVSPDQITSDVRRRIFEIMSQAGALRDQRPPQDMMITTYDVSPMGTPPPEEVKEESTEREEFLQSLTKNRREEMFEEKVYPEGEGSLRQNGQEWFDDDFGLSRTRREAEELRLQELQIEQEIQQLQAQQDSVPYFYLREIPNKPPPPYTPPGKPLAEIPATEAEILSVTSTAVRILTDEMTKGREVMEVEPSWDYYGNVASEHVKSYKLFLFDLAKHLLADLIEQQETKEEVLPWMRTRERLSRYKYQKIERTLDSLNEFVQKQVLLLFGFGRKLGKESLIVGWIKKKRDHVDEILAAESQKEEPQWTQYDEDQIAVKNEVTLSLLDSLLDETAQIINVIFNKKLKNFK